jgi:hypothetical protein
MTGGETVSSGVRPRPMSTWALAIAAVAILALLGCRVTLSFDQPEAGVDALKDAHECSTDQQCSSPRPRCDLTKGRCVGCLTTSDCTGNQICDLDSMSCRTPDL